MVHWTWLVTAALASSIVTLLIFGIVYMMVVEGASMIDIIRACKDGPDWDEREESGLLEED